MECDFGELAGVTLASVDGLKKNSKTVKFKASDGREWLMYHERDCCEVVYLEDVAGDPEDLIGSPILSATEETNRDKPLEETDERFLWTFYRIGTIRGTVVMRWYGVSNGYYSESVTFERVESQSGTTVP